MKLLNDRYYRIKINVKIILKKKNKTIIITLKKRVSPRTGGGGINWILKTVRLINYCRKRLSADGSSKSNYYVHERCKTEA